MFNKKLFNTLQRVYGTYNNLRPLHNSPTIFCSQRGKPEEPKNRQLIRQIDFQKVDNKDKQTYLEMVKIFVNRDTVYRRGHVEFIYSALKHMKEFGVHKDLEVYKSLIDVLPKGKFIPTNIFQAEFMHYPKQQQCIIELLEQMEENGVMPDFTMEDQLLNIFGKRGYPLRKYWRMMYWMPKFKNSSPWLLPSPLPQDIFDLAKLAIERISSADPQSEVEVFQTADVKDSIDATWVVTAQSKTQKHLLTMHNKEEPLFVEGSFKVWLQDKAVNYFILRGEPKPIDDQVEDSDDVSHIKVPIFGSKPPEKKLTVVPSVHEQEDGIIYSVCATGTSSKDSLLSWIRLLETNGNPDLADIPIVFTLKSSHGEVVTVNEAEKKDLTS